LKSYIADSAPTLLGNRWPIQ